MPVEAELKARLNDPDTVRSALARRASGETATYCDTYYDDAGSSLERTGRELRLRTVETPHATRHLLTFKDPAVDKASGSKPEYETAVATPAAVAHMLQALGHRPVVELTKDCENYRFVEGGREFLATVVRVPEIDGTFLEVETMAEEGGVDGALAAVRAVLADLGVAETDLTNELYTDAVRAARSR